MWRLTLLTSCSAFLSLFFGQQPAWVIRIAAALERWDWLRLQRTFLSNSDSILFMFPHFLTHQQYMLLWNTYVLRVIHPFWGCYGVGDYRKWLSVRGRVHPGQFARLLQSYTERQPTIHIYVISMFVKLPVNLTSKTVPISLDCGSKLEYLLRKYKVYRETS